MSLRLMNSWNYGYACGTIQGTVHLSMFTPMVHKLFGDRWFEQGTLSMYYTFATVDKEEVRARDKSLA